MDSNMTLPAPFPSLQKDLIFQTSNFTPTSAFLKKKKQNPAGIGVGKVLKAPKGWILTDPEILAIAYSNVCIPHIYVRIL